MKKNWIYKGLMEFYNSDELHIIEQNTLLLSAESCNRVWLALLADRAFPPISNMLCEEGDKFVRYIYRAVVCDIAELNELKSQNPETDNNIV